MNSSKKSFEYVKFSIFSYFNFVEEENYRLDLLCQ